MMSRREWIILGVSLPLLALFGLLAWAMARTDGAAGGLSVNSELGEVAVTQQPVPDFTATDLDGGEITLSDLQGKIVMIDFWSSWCPPCRAESPTLSQVYHEYRDRGVEFVGIAIWDEVSDTQRFVNEFDLQYPNAIDPRGRIAISYGVKGIPEKYFVDSNGVLMKKLVGPVTYAKLTDTLDQLLATQAAPISAGAAPKVPD